MDEKMAEFKVTSRELIEDEEDKVRNCHTRLKLRQMCAILLNKSLRTPFYQLRAYKDFIGNRDKMLSKLPTPRRKQWWEKLVDTQYDHFYEEGLTLLPTVPPQYQ